MIVEAMKGIGQRNVKGATKYFFLFVSSLFLKRSDMNVMNDVSDIIVVVKNNTKGLCKDTINNMTKYLPGVT